MFSYLSAVSKFLAQSGQNMVSLAYPENMYTEIFNYERGDNANVTMPPVVLFPTKMASTMKERGVSLSYEIDTRA